MSNAFIEVDVSAEDYGPYKRLSISGGEILEGAWLDRDQCRTLARFIGEFLEADQVKRFLMHLTISPDQEVIRVGVSRKLFLSVAINDVEAHMESWEARRLMKDLLDGEASE